MTFQPSGLAICALLAGSLASGPAALETDSLHGLLALWVLADLALGACYAALVEASQELPWAAPGAQHEGKHAWQNVAISGGMGILVAASFGQEIRLLTAAGLVLGAVAALAGAGHPLQQSKPLLAGLQVAIAWSLGLAHTGPWPTPLFLLGLAAGVGTWLRLRHEAAPSSATLWGIRLLWLASAALLVWARQPLLGALVALTAFADDLYRLGPHDQGVMHALMTLGWVGTWLLVGLAATYWGIPT